MNRLLEVMRRLRAPNGCPWDRKQTHASLRPYLLEEASEAVDAITAGQPEHMAEELGDVLLQVAFHAVIAEEEGAFDYDTIETSIVDKLVRRHPHVFGDVNVGSADEVVRNWQQIKAEEKGGEPAPQDRVPRSLPALMRAAEMGKVLSWSAGSPEAVTRALTAPTDGSAKVGALLLAAVDYARALGVNPELALREAVEARAHEDTRGAGSPAP